MQENASWSTSQKLSSPRVRFTNTYTHMQACKHTRSCLCSHTSFPSRPLGSRQGSTFRLTESVPSEIHRILLCKAIVSYGSGSICWCKAIAFRFGFRGRGLGPLPWCAPGVSRRRVEVVVKATEAFIHALVVALVGGCVHLVFSGRDLQCAIPHAVAKVDEHPWKDSRLLAEKI